MRKLICIALMCWLPLFMTAANAMAMQMSLETMQPATIHAQTNSHAHCHESSSQVDSKHIDHQTADTQTHKPTHSHCTTCGFCVISHAITHQVVTFLTAGTQSANLVAPAVRFSSVDYPPAIKPPILH